MSDIDIFVILGLRLTTAPVADVTSPNLNVTSATAFVKFVLEIPVPVKEPELIVYLKVTSSPSTRPAIISAA